MAARSKKRNTALDSAKTVSSQMPEGGHRAFRDTEEELPEEMRNGEVIQLPPPSALPSPPLPDIETSREAERDPLATPTLPVDVLDIKPRFNLRKGLVDDDDPSLDGLKQAMRALGYLIEPVVVRPREDAPGRFWLVAGERRLRSARSLGWESVEIRIIRGNEDEAIFAMIQENLQREEPQSLDYADYYDQLLDQGMTQEALAERLGVTGGYISSIRKVGHSPVLRVRLEQRDIEWRTARKIGQLYDRQGNERVSGSVDAILKWINDRRPSPGAIEEMVDRIKRTEGIPEELFGRGPIQPYRRSYGEQRRLQWEMKERPRVAKLSRPELEEYRNTLHLMLKDTEQLLAARTADSDESSAGE